MRTLNMMLLQIYFILFLTITKTFQDITNIFNSCQSTCISEIKNIRRQYLQYCWTEPCFKCINSTHSSGSNKLNTTNIHQPRLLCKDSDVNSASFYFEWSQIDQDMSIFYVIWIRECDKDKIRQWNFLHQDAFVAIPKGFEIKGLKFDHDYQLQITVMSFNEILVPLSLHSSNWLKTLSENAQLSPPTNVTVQEFDLTTSSSGQISALVSWIFPPDYFCNYAVHLKSVALSEPEIIEVNILNEYPIQLHNLMYSENYTVYVYSTNRYTEESVKTTTWFMTPTCLSLNNNNYTICKPDAPEITKLRFISPNQIDVHWIPPMFISKYNPILKYNVTWYKRFNIEEVINNKEFSNNFTQFVPENETSTIFTNLDIGNVYDVEVTAFSQAGFSQSNRRSVTIPAGAAVVDDDSGFSLLHVLAVCIPVFVSLTIMLIIINRCNQYKRQKTLKNESEKHLTGNMQNLSLGSVSAIVPVVDITNHKNKDKFELDITDFLLAEEIGHGAFGIVYKAKIHQNYSRDNQEVAVKMLKSNCSEDDKEQLLQEIEILKNVGSHPNIIRLVACCTIGPKICLAVEFCAGGDLLSHLRKLREKYTEAKNSLSDSDIDSNSRHQVVHYAQLLTDESTDSSCSTHLYTNVHHYVNDCKSLEVNKITITPSSLLSYGRQTASGMEYLSANKFIHRDLACRNILLTSDNIIKISDFGLTRDVYERSIYQKTTSGKLPLKWMAPESILCQLYTTKSDVWSFGIVLWEITTLGCSPYPGIDNRKILDLLTNGYRMRKPDNCSTEVYQLMIACWLPNPNLRPTFNQLRLMLERMLELNVEYFNFSINS